MRTRRGLDRLLTFLDAVVAIAITLLVLPLIDVLDDVPGRSLPDVLREDGELFGTFLLRFVVIAQLWRTHHRIAEGVGSYDSAFVTINLVWLLTIVFLPFATQVAAVYGHQRLAVAVYLGTVTLSSLCLAALSLLIDRRPALSGEDTGPGRTRSPGRAAPSLLLVVALVAGVAVPAVGYAATLLLVLGGPVQRLLQRRVQRAG